MDVVQRQQLLSVLAKSSLKDIQQHWEHSLHDFEYSPLRAPQTGMVMAVARAEGSGEPFNLGEVSVTRCAIKLTTGQTGIGYVMGSSKEHSLHVALLDALAQVDDQYEDIKLKLIQPLQQKIEQRNQQQQQKTAATKVDFLTMVRGEDDE